MMRLTYHARQRAVERLGFDLTQEDADAIERGIRDGTFFLMSDRLYGNKSLYSVFLRGRAFSVVVGPDKIDPEILVIVTVRSVGMTLAEDLKLSRPIGYQRRQKKFRERTPYQRHKMKREF